MGMRTSIACRNSFVPMRMGTVSWEWEWHRPIVYVCVKIFLFALNATLGKPK